MTELMALRNFYTVTKHGYETNGTLGLITNTPVQAHVQLRTQWFGFGHFTSYTSCSLGSCLGVRRIQVSSGRDDQPVVA